MPVYNTLFAYTCAKVYERAWRLYTRQNAFDTETCMCIPCLSASLMPSVVCRDVGRVRCALCVSDGAGGGPRSRTWCRGIITHSARVNTHTHTHTHTHTMRHWIATRRFFDTTELSRVRTRKHSRVRTAEASSSESEVTTAAQTWGTVYGGTRSVRMYRHNRERDE